MHLEVKIGNTRLVEVLLFAAALLCVTAQIVSVAGGSFLPKSEWAQTFFLYTTSFHQIVTIFNYTHKICLLIILFVVIAERGMKSPVLVIVCVFGFLIYLFLEMSKGYSAIDAAFRSVPVSVFLIPAYIVLSADDGIVQKIIKWSYPFAMVCFALSALITLWFRVIWGWSMEFGDFPGRTLFCYGICSMWIACFAPRVGSEVDIKHLVLLCLLGLFGGFLLNVRSWVIQCAIAFLVLFAIKARGKLASSRTMKALVALVVFAAIIAVVFPAAFGTFAARLGEDNRSGQYEVFFSQVSPSALVLGGGIDASYVKGSNSDYRYFDNQLLFMAFHFGLIPVVTLLYVFARSLFAKTKRLDRRGLKFVVLAWLAAIVGLSTYFSYELNYFIVSLIAIISIDAWPDRRLKRDVDRVCEG